MKKVIIGIHGLGNKPPEDLLKKWWSDAMLEGFAAHGINKKLPRFELIYWADIMYLKPLDVYERDVNSQYYMDEPYVKSSDFEDEDPHPLRQKFNDFVSDQLNKIFLNQDRTLNYSIITDILLNRYFKDLELYYKDDNYERGIPSFTIKEKIRDRVAQVIRRYKGYDICIVAHSMGSIIAYDVLSYVIPEIKIKTLITIGSPLGLPVIISKIAAEQLRFNKVKNEISTPPGIEYGWFNLTDIKDPIAINYKLSDDFAKNANGVYPVDYLVYNNYQINRTKNPHKSYGYLRTKEFSLIVASFIDIKSLNFTGRILKRVKSILKVK
ncbi:MAG: hypothetical protein CVU10_05360 [Bacteroidetes bacterium HGW-Bacteroidetes-5]|jgi:hypothetical protein|nr:MAG: hypothetical protein CVU10_05360 [Bacteroidetes bacterium HGW-Bacteroidetes-5]